MREPHNTDIEYAFYNDRVKELIPKADIEEPFTYVPIKAGHMELVGGNALVFGEITEGYDVINPSVETVITYEDISDEMPRQGLDVKIEQVGDDLYVYLDPVWAETTPYNEGRIVQVDSGLGFPWFFRSKVDNNIGHNPIGFGGGTWWQSIEIWQGVTSIRRVTARILITLPRDVSTGDYYYVVVRNDSEGLNLVAEYEVQALDTVADVKLGLQNSLQALGVDVGDILADGDDNELYLFERPHDFPNTPYNEPTDLKVVFQNFNPMVSAFFLAEGNVVLHPQLKVGATHSFGIVYKDRSGRTCSVMKTESMNVYIPFYAEEALNNLDTVVNLVFLLYHKPPAWAHTYEIVYFGNMSMSYFMQIRADNITSLGNDRYGVNVQQTFENTYDNNARWRIAPYEWQQGAGDRLRLVGYIDETTGVVTKYDEVYDYEIEETGTQHGEELAGDWLMLQAINHPDWFGNTTQIENTAGTLDGTVVPTQAYEEGAVRVDTITLAGGGAGDTADIYCAGIVRELIYNASLDQTATDFVTVNAADFLARGVIVTAPGGGTIVFTMQEDSVDFPSQTNIIVEIYRPRKGLGSTEAYGTGMVFEIGEDEYGNKYHKGDVDQVINAVGECTTRAQIENTANDCWKFIRLNFRWESEEVMHFHAESYYPSDWWDEQTAFNRLTSMGFPFLDDLSQRQTVLPERLRHGGFIVTGTRTNNLAHFTFGDFLDLPKKNGKITALREVGYVLKVLQLHKETSIYIGRIANFNADGTPNLTITDQFLGTVYPMNDDFGCQHPNSVMVNGRYLYYWDNNEGELIRSAPNGQIAISGPEYKMSRWFKDLTRWIKANGGAGSLVVNAGANNEYDEVWVTFRMGDDIKGVVFSEKNGRFTTRINQITQAYVHLGNFFAHIYKQRLWIMNVDEGQDWLTWANEPTYAIIEVVSNIEPTKNKVFTSVALFADYEMESLEEYVRIPAEASGVHALQESNMPILDRREGVFFGEIMKDVNSKGVFSDLYDRKLNGNEMRGRYCFVKFFTDRHDDKVRIDSIAIFSTPSERNV
jgi:hypothetical protein